MINSPTLLPFSATYTIGVADLGLYLYAGGSVNLDKTYTVTYQRSHCHTIHCLVAYPFASKHE